MSDVCFKVKPYYQSTDEKITLVLQCIIMNESKGSYIELILEVNL